MSELPVLNQATAHFECTFGRGCIGLCCQEARPPLYEEDVAQIDSVLPRVLPLLRPSARAMIEKQGFLTPRFKRIGLPVLRVSGGWCVFFNEGCVLHKVGAMDGDKYRYKPALCSLFPLQVDRNDNWYIRQKGYKSEKWDLFCLDP